MTDPISGMYKIKVVVIQPDGNKAEWVDEFPEEDLYALGKHGIYNSLVNTIDRVTFAAKAAIGDQLRVRISRPRPLSRKQIHGGSTKRLLRRAISWLYH